jgi:hypothetical protein
MSAAMRSLWERWKRFGRKIGDIQARLLLTFFYFVLMSPFALALRRWSDPLAIKSGSPRGWQPKVEQDGSSVEKATRQF